MQRAPGDKIPGRDIPERDDSSDGRNAQSRVQETRDANRRQMFERNIMQMDTRDHLYIDPKTWAPGKVYRWIRLSCLGEPDFNREAYMSSMGWEPVPYSRHPELMMNSMMPDRNNNPNNCIIRTGLILCERDKYLDDLESQKVAARTKREKDSLQALDKFDEPTMPLVVQQNSVVNAHGNPMLRE